jgi:hypothetical protein
MALLTSCNNDSSGPKKTEAGVLQNVEGVKDQTFVVQPEAFTVTKANLSPEEKKERFNLGCKIQGENGASSELDSQLKIGQVFKSQYAVSQIQGSESEATTEITIKDIQPNKITSEANYEKLKISDFPFTTPDQVFSQKPHAIQILTYKLRDDGGYEVMSQTPLELMNMRPNVLDYVKTHNLDSKVGWNCYVDYSVDSISSVDKIQYNLNGKIIVAYLLKNVRTGDVRCRKYNSSETSKDEEVNVSMGLGRSEDLTIYTNEIVSESFLECGGARIYSSIKTVLDTGKVVDSYAHKTLVAPER